MTLSEFAQKLFPYCNNGENKGEFFINLIEASVNETTNKFFTLSNDYYTRLFEGRKFPTYAANYIISHIDKEKLDNTFLNETPSEDALIELCNIFEPYIGNATKDNVATKITTLFVNIMKNLSTQNKEIEKMPISINMEQSLSQIVNNLSKLTPEKIDCILKYEPYNVKKKIEPQNSLLLNDIKNDVVNYYTHIENLFKEASKENSSFFDKLAKAIKFASDNYIAQGLTQQTIVNNMISWIKSRALSENETACRIMVAFFIQNCEVFHEITK